MILDARFDSRDSGMEEIFRELKDILASKLGENVHIEVRTYAQSDAAKIKAFVTMSGCRTKVDKQNECYIMLITGSPCCA